MYANVFSLKEKKSIIKNESSKKKRMSQCYPKRMICSTWLPWEPGAGYQGCLSSRIVMQLWNVVWELDSCLYPTIVELRDLMPSSSLLGAQFLHL